ncbi:hypothetical protein CC80DRAFT_33622 [Byssothecium circinans]|uniref:Uncharacterized protein n=1 Tax=Byssothecium circinans TaxID=147558 RepID=A0A6A5U1Q1_9PLEO|nr:hypothetical protein CC80DRAFT_33622 [Byssothecium circinans]
MSGLHTVFLAQMFRMSETYHMSFSPMLTVLCGAVRCGAVRCCATACRYLMLQSFGAVFGIRMLWPLTARPCVRDANPRRRYMCPTYVR